MSDKVQLTSRWFYRHEFDKFVQVLTPGDIVEFHRGTYRHFGLYADVIDMEGFRDKKHLIVHMTDYRSDKEKLSQCIELLVDVWESSAVRFNNSRDKQFPPHRSPSEIVSFAVGKVIEFANIRKKLEDKRRERSKLDQEIRQLEGRYKEAEYNLAYNNCEHNATNWRNGQHCSQQVQTAVTAGSVVAGLAVVGLGFLGFKLLSDASSNKGKKEEDDEQEEEEETHRERMVRY